MCLSVEITLSLSVSMQNLSCLIILFSSEFYLLWFLFLLHQTFIQHHFLWILHRFILCWKSATSSFSRHIDIEETKSCWLCKWTLISFLSMLFYYGFLFDVALILRVKIWYGIWWSMWSVWNSDALSYATFSYSISSSSSKMFLLYAFILGSLTTVQSI